MEKIIRREGGSSRKEQLTDYYSSIQIAYNSDNRLTMRFIDEDGDVLINFTCQETNALLQFVKKLVLTRKELDELPY